VPGKKPVFVKVSSETNARSQDCFFNVKDRIQRDGGKLISGWMIWLWPKVLIEAEYHGIWETTSGRWIDITPKTDGEKKILFLEDPSVAWDFSNFKRLGNRRLPLSNDPDIADMIYCTEQVELFLLQLPRYTVGVPHVPDQIEVLQQKRASLVQKLRETYG
jgi:hypothetical protein